MAARNLLLWIFITTGVLLSIRPSQARRTICLPQPSEVGVSILGGMEAGNFVNLGTAKDINECLQRACNSQEGNIAFLLHQTCFSVKCYSTQSCDLETLDSPGTKTAGALYRIIAAYPVFQNAPKVIDIDEDTISGKEVLRLNPSAESRIRDKETMMFEIQAGNTDRTFRLYPKLSNRRVSIHTRKALDREKIPSYHLTIKATNRIENVSSLLNITINITDINDNRPRFATSLFVFNVFSNMTVGASLGRLVAKDNDTGENAKLEYTITPESDLITLNPGSGEVKLSKTLRVDAVKSYDYDITVTDGIHTTESRLRVEVYPNNVNRPTFYKYSYEIRLNGQVPANTEVVRVDASDPDFGKLGELTYLIRNGDEYGMFRITGNGEIRTASRLAPRQEIYNLTIDVHDNGYPELHALKSANVVILIQWLRFKQDIYHTAVLEDLRLSENVFTVSASVWVGGTELMAGQRRRSSNGINYYLDDVMSLDQFEMEETTGVINLRKTLDYEKRKVYELELRADKENADSTSRTVLTAKAILQVQVLDVNDNAPRFSRLFYSQDVWRSSKVNSPVLKINATDADQGDNGLIKFVVISGNFNNTFSFDSDGMMFLRKSLTRTKLATFNITIAAWDSGQPELRSAHTALVTIHVRGYTPRAPLFSKTSYKAMVSESIPIGKKIIQIKANVYQARSRISYWIPNSEHKMPFRIESNTGWIRNTQRLDREKKTSYVLTTVASTDLGRVSLTSVINVTIILDDENDNRPVFTRDYYSAILTSHEVGSDVLQINATDSDRGANGRIVYKIKGGRDKKYFSINSSTGLITTKSVLPTQSLLLLKCFVSAQDDGTPPMSSSKAVQVYVLIGSTFPIQVTLLTKTPTKMKLRFTMINVTLEDISYIGVVAQEEDKLTDYEEITKRPLQSWFYIHNTKGNGVFAQRYLTGKVQCTNYIRKTKTFDFTVGADGKKCTKNKKKFCNGQLQAEKMYRLQLVAYFKNGTTPENVTNVYIESIITSAFVTRKAENANRSAGFRSWHYDVIVIVLGVIVGLIIIAIITRAVMLYRRDKLRMKKEEAKDGISYPLSNPRYRRSGEHSPSSRSTISFAELSKSRQAGKKLEKVSPSETEKLQIGQDETGGISRDSGCGVSVKSSNSFITHTRTSVRRALFSFGKKNKDDEEEEEEEASDKEIETELNT